MTYIETHQVLNAHNGAQKVLPDKQKLKVVWYLMDWFTFSMQTLNPPGLEAVSFYGVIITTTDYRGFSFALLEKL